MSTSNQLSANQLREALQIREQMDSLQQRFNSLFSGGGTGRTGARGGRTSQVTSQAKAPATAGKTGRRKMSAQARAKIAAAQRARWSKQKGQASQSSQQDKSAAATSSGKAAGGGKGKRTISPAARAKMAEAARKRWAAKKQNG